MNQHPIVWTVAGSDSGGGAGIQADLKTFHALDVHGCSMITALTAQNSCRVDAVMPVEAAAIGQQFQALADDLPPKVIKTGLLTAAAIEQLRAYLVAQTTPPQLVIDPVLESSSGTSFLDADASRQLLEQLFPFATAVTPNVREAAQLTGLPTDHPEQIEAAARRLREFGATTVVITGGDSAGRHAIDYVLGGGFAFWLHTRRIPTQHHHGSGCTHAAALAAALAQGFVVRDAVVIAKAVVNRALRVGYAAGQGRGPVNPQGWPAEQRDLPWLSDAPIPERPSFPQCNQPRLGLYPVVDSVAWVRKLCEWGVDTAQLRIKTLQGDALRAAIAQSVSLARATGMRLFINDYWEQAIALGAYGVHLGQDDLKNADIDAIEAAGLRLGVSTHAWYELARAHALRPSYLAIGPIYPTDSKAMPWIPQGLENLRFWRQRLDYPLVGIGGIDVTRAEQVAAAGADGIAMISALTKAQDPYTVSLRLREAIARGWQQMPSKRFPEPSVISTLDRD